MFCIIFSNDSERHLLAKDFHVLKSIFHLSAAVGLLHLKGEGCVKSKEHSLKWLKKSAESGSIYGTGLLAYFYYSSKLYSKAIEIAQRSVIL